MTTLLLRFFLFVCCGLVILGNQAVGGDVVKLPPNATIPAVLMFGDSIVDTGNNNVNLKTPARCNFPPYGREFEGGISTGRYSNGKVPSDLIGCASASAFAVFDSHSLTLTIHDTN